MALAHPIWLWLALTAPLAIGIAAWCWRRRLRATAEWASRGLWNRLLPTYSRRRLTASVVLLGIALAAVAVTLAQPRWGMSEQRIERRGVDIVFVLDTSLSMATRDIAPNRLWVAQTVVRQLIKQLPGHRVALVQAEGDGVVMVPLTADSAVIDLVLDSVLPGSLPLPGTELEPALERALALFPDSEGKHRVMVLLSDGEDHAGGIERIADKLEDEGVVVHALGIGTREGKPLEMPELSGGPVGFKRDDSGQVVVSKLEERNLETISRKTGGLYSRITSAGTDLAPLIERIDGMEKQSYGSETINVLEERFQWPLALAIIALALYLGLAPFRRRGNASEEPAW